ncbi:TfoX/Sxy family protein [Limnoglobus roseus]|uniref:RNA methyltransferase n=1 Tax=Limnoglobus roseus TaxID=2598579 RepID=A0A5C1A826_9BACT|nr:TfoX/Sxy family protein [Limnoglobus roseus]QEL13284.1 RNA methyltransferase [Limnoglobus roseus]
MPYDEGLADRVRDCLGDRRDVTEKKMFGGLAFLLGGRLTVAVRRDASLLVRIAPDDVVDALQDPAATQFRMRGRTLRGWLMIDPDGIEEDEQLAEWVNRAAAFIESLPPK